MFISEAYLLSDRGVVQAQFLGLQRQLLHSIQLQGPSCLTQPTDLYNLCVYSGLLTRTHEQPASATLVSVKYYPPL